MLLNVFSPRTQKQVDLCEFEANLVYRMSFRIAKATQRDFTWNTKQTKRRGGRKGGGREGSGWCQVDNLDCQFNEI